MSLLTGFRVVQVGPGLAAAVCGRLMADVGAGVVCIDADTSTSLAAYLNLQQLLNLTVESFLEHSAVEFNPAQLAIEEFGVG